MRRLFLASCLLLSASALAASGQDHGKGKDAALGKKSETTLDKSLAGDITRKKEDKQAAPALQYDQFRLGVELQVASKRHEQIESLKRIIDLTRGSGDTHEMPALLFRLGELYFEESKYFFFEANRKDDDLIRAMNANDQAGQARAKEEKEQLSGKSKQFAQLATEAYSEIVQKYKDYERTDEVLYFLGHNLMEQGDDRKSLVAYKRLVDKYPKSKFLPDAYLAFGEYYFNTSKGKREYLEKALDNYKKAAADPGNQVYAFALYKQGWCYFNLADYQRAMDMFKTVVLYGELAGAAAVEKDGGKSGKNSLVKEARNDFVRSYAQIGSPQESRAEFSKVASKPEDRFLMTKQLANLWYEDGKDKEAALTFNMLIQEQPLSPDAPGFQGKIVDCVLRAGNKKMTVMQVRRLVKIMQDVERSGNIKSDKDRQSLKEARELSERTLSNLAVNWHNEAKKTRDDETFAYANEVYGDYLALFPENPKAYDLRFFWAELLNDNLQKYDKAAEQYTQVLMMDAKRLESSKDASGKFNGKTGKYMVNAAYDAVLAYDEVVKRAEQDGSIKSETPAGADMTKPLKIPPVKQALLDSCERYMKYVPNGDKKVEIAYKAARLLYSYNHFDEAVKRFADIALNYPDYKFEDGNRAAEVSANLILDSYNLLGDWAKVNEWARKFYANDRLATGKFREDLSKVLEQSSFKLVNQLEAKKEFAKAAEAYLTFVSEFPKSEIADKALFNASIDYFNAKMLDKAMATRQRIIEKYPKSEFVPACIYANAEGHEAVGDFDEAAQAYEWYVRGYEKSLDAKDAGKGGGKNKRGKKVTSRAKGKKGKHAEEKDDASEKKEVVQHWDEQKAQVALFNAGVFREGLTQYKQALKDREHYLELWDNSKDAEAVFLSIADLWEKMGAHSKAISQYEEYEKKYVREPNKVLMAEGKMAEIFEKKLHRAKEADRIHARILKFYKELGPRARKSLDPVALDAVGHADYLKNEDDYRFYASLRLKWGRGPAPEKEFKAGLQEKAKRLKVVTEDYTQTVQLKAGEPAVCALYKLGLAFDNMVETLVNAPMPRGAPPELQDAIRDEMSKQAEPVREKAAEALATAVQKSRELDIHNDCSQKALKLLRDTYKPDVFPPMMEDVAELKGAAKKAQLLPGELLASIQPIPVYTAQQLEAAKARAASLQPIAAPDANEADLKGMRDSAPRKNEAVNDTPPSHDELAPEPGAQPAPAPQPQSSGSKAGPGNGSNGGSTSGSDEPEDNL